MLFKETNMRVENLVVRCYAQHSDGIWQAICIDLNLAVEAGSLGEAKAKLEAQIAEYVYDAIAGEDQGHGAALLSRRTPLEFRAKYYAIRAALLRHVMSFTETLPLVPTWTR